MVDICPKCHVPLTKRTIKKELSLGSIDYPIARVCPKCNWTEDLTGAGNIVTKAVEKPVMPLKQEMVGPEEVKPPKPEPAGGINKMIPIVLALLVIGAIAIAFYTSSHGNLPAVPQTVTTPFPTQVAVTPVITSTPSAAAATSIITPTGTEKFILLDLYRIYRNEASRIKSGDKVTWKNTGKDPITLVSRDIPDFERNLDYDKITSYTFTKAGTYTFYLKGKASLNATIVVES